MFFGCVGVDKYSKILEDKARSEGVNVRYQYTETTSTGTCAVLITGHHRSLCANLAAANLFTIDHINSMENRKYLDNAEFFYISVCYNDIINNDIFINLKFKQFCN